MSIITSMYNGASGLASNDMAMEIVGNNIANVNTVGYKSSRANFAEVLGRTVLGGTGTLGAGSGVSSIDRLFTQGSFLSTGQSLDLAIGGKGFFAVSGSHNGNTGTFYSRAGQFHLNETGNVVNTQGLTLQGYPASNGQIGGSLGDIKVTETQLSPKATTSAEMFVGLDGEATELPVVDLDVNDSSTYNFMTKMTVYDSLGNDHNLDVYFNKTATGWSWTAMTDQDGDDVVDPVGSGALTFTEKGLLDEEVVTTAIDISYTGAAPNQAIAIDFGESITENGSGASGTTAYVRSPEGESNMISMSQDGYATGSLQGVTVDQSGVIYGAYSNGERTMLGQVALAMFP